MKSTRTAIQELSVKTVIVVASMLVTCLSRPGWCEEPAPSSNSPHYYLKAKRRTPRLIECDVAVYGGTPAGVTSAIQAARTGKKTVLLSFNQHLGGMTSGGLTATDLGRQESIGGLALEFYNRLGRKSNFRPSEAESLFLKMLDEAGLGTNVVQKDASVILTDNLLEMLQELR